MFQREREGEMCCYIFLKFAVSKFVFFLGRREKILPRVQECYFNGTPFTLEGNIKSRKEVNFLRLLFF